MRSESTIQREENRICNREGFYYGLIEIMGAGRPFGSFKYNPEEMLEEANKYFADCDSKFIDKGIAGKTPKPKTLSGLCLWLGVSRDYLSEKAKDANYSDTIKEIRMNVENNIEEGILTGTYNATSGIFNLKNNFDWKDKSEVDQRTETIDVSNIINDEQKKKIANRYK